MRRKLNVILGLAVLAGTPGCLDLDEQIVSGVTTSYFETQAGLEDAVRATYAHTREFYGRERGMTLSSLGTDIWTKGADGSYKHYNDYTPQLSAGDNFARETWEMLYRGINTANAVVDRAPGVPMTEALKNQRIAETRFLRAFFYFHLVQLYGDVHLSLTETVGVVNEASRTPARDIYKAIVDDLEFAVATLPATQSQYGRATKGAAQHLLSKVLLTRAYRPYKEATDFERAAELARAVIANTQYGLLPRFSSIFDIGAQQHREVVWSIQYTLDPLTNNPGNEWHLYWLMEYDVLPGMRRDIANGRPWKRLMPTPFLLGLWDRDRDVRYEQSFQNVWYANNASTIPRGADGQPRFALGDTAIWLPGHEVSAEFRASKPFRIYTPSQYTHLVYPTLNKHLDPTRPDIQHQHGQRHFMYARLAETYLLAAEALVGAGKPAEAVPLINAVRRRAARPGMEAAMEITAADVTLDFILDERARELAGEGHRWFDLVRTGTFMERVRAHNTDARPNVQAHHMLRPIPSTQIDRTKGGAASFPQNPGY